MFLIFVDPEQARQGASPPVPFWVISSPAPATDFHFLFSAASLPASQPRAPNLCLLLQLPVGYYCAPFSLPVPASQAHSLGTTFCFGLSLSPRTPALPKSHRIRLCSTATSAHPGHPPVQPLPFASPWHCQLRSHAAWASPRGSARFTSQPGMLTLSPTQSPSYHFK